MLYWLCQSLWLCGSQETVEILREMGIPDHLTCLLRILYAGQEATVRTGHGTTVWFQIRKGVHQGCILSLCLFNFMQNTSWETQARIKIAGRNMNSLWYADDIQQICRWYHSNGRKWKGTKETPDEGERGE